MLSDATARFEPLLNQVNLFITVGHLRHYQTLFATMHSSPLIPARQLAFHRSLLVTLASLT